MRRLDDPEFVPYLLKTEWSRQQIGEYNNRHNAVMQLPCGIHMLRVIAASGAGWDHVSISLASRTPTWAEMEYVKRMLFKPHEVAMQLHVPPSDHINRHPNCLHLWRPTSHPIPLPPKNLV